MLAPDALAGWGEPRIWPEPARESIEGTAVKSSPAIKRTRPQRFIGAECPPPRWISRSPQLGRAYALAAEAHGEQRRATDMAPFLEHVTEVAELLEDAGHDDQLIAAALLHDAVERGSLTEPRLRAEMDEEISELVLALTESAEIDSFSERKRALRRQVEAAGARAITIFAADKLSDIRALRRGIDTDRESLEARMGTTVEQLAGHYRESVAMVEQNDPRSEFVAALRAELDTLAAGSA
jgi:(p)ppGpp synthase/HD superfamily hydrolase